MKNSKRILSVTIKRMVDEDPDTSYFGEYSQRASSEFSIDRAHSEDCAFVVPVNQDGVQKLRNARAYIVDLQTATAHREEWDDLEDAYHILDVLADDSPECDCGRRGDMGRHEYRYFNPSFNYVNEFGKPAQGHTPDEVRLYVRQDYDRMERLNAGDWGYIGIRAQARITTLHGRDGGGCGVIQTISSGGLWGIESDSEKSYIESVQQEELAGLKSELLALGFSRRAISTAFKSLEEVSE